MLEDAIHSIATTPLRRLAPARVYPPIRAGTPHVMLLRLPPVFWHESNTTEHYKLVVVETPTEMDEAEMALDQPPQVHRHAGWVEFDFKPTIGKVAGRPSGRPDGNGTIIHYEPPEAGWPHVVLMVLPENSSDQGFARQRYACELFTKTEDVAAHLSVMAMELFQELLAANKDLDGEEGDDDDL